MSTINFTIISEIVDLVAYINEYAANISTGDFGHNDSRLTQMPKVYEALQKWEEKNVSVLSLEDKNIFFAAKECIEKLMVHFKIDSIEVLIKK